MEFGASAKHIPPWILVCTLAAFLVQTGEIVENKVYDLKISEINGWLVQWRMTKPILFRVRVFVIRTGHADLEGQFLKQFANGLTTTRKLK